MKWVLILGAGSDVGVACARKFAENGYSIVLAGRNAQRFEPMASDLAIRFSVQARTCEFDAVDFPGHDRLTEELGLVPDVVICVFGYLGDQKEAVVDWKHSQRIIDANYSGAVSVLNVLSRAMVQRGQGSIIGISSVAGERGRQSNYIYGSAKAGFTAYLSGLRNELTQHKIPVLTVKPGFIDTKMTEELELPPLLTAQPGEVAQKIYKAYRKKKDVIYVKSIWRWIMWIIRNIPEFVFKKMKL